MNSLVRTGISLIPPFRYTFSSTILQYEAQKFSSHFALISELELKSVTLVCQLHREISTNVTSHIRAAGPKH